MDASPKNTKEQFRKRFVLTITIVYAIAFFAMLSNFFQALLLAAVFTGVVYPLYQWIQRKIPGNSDSLASFVTITVTTILIVIPLIIMLDLIAVQAINVAKDITPVIEQRLGTSSTTPGLPEWLPYSKELEPHSKEITAKLAEFVGTAGKFLAATLANLTQGTVSFFFQLFVMLYAMFFFLTGGPVLLRIIFSYVPLSQNDKDKLLAVGASVSRATVKGTLIIGLIQGILGGIGFAAAGIDGAMFWGAMMAVLSVLPGIGTALIWGPAVIYLLISEQLLPGAGLLTWSAIIVGGIDNLLRPMLVGRDAEMPDLLILLSTLGGLSLFGASGLVLGPILAALFLTILTIYHRVFSDWLDVDPHVSLSFQANDVEE